MNQTQHGLVAQGSHIVLQEKEVEVEEEEEEEEEEEKVEDHLKLQEEGT